MYVCTCIYMYVCACMFLVYHVHFSCFTCDFPLLPLQCSRCRTAVVVSTKTALEPTRGQSGSASLHRFRALAGPHILMHPLSMRGKICHCFMMIVEKMVKPSHIRIVMSNRCSLCVHACCHPLDFLPFAWMFHRITTCFLFLICLPYSHYSTPFHSSRLHSSSTTLCMIHGRSPTSFRSPASSPRTARRRSRRRC